MRERSWTALSAVSLRILDGQRGEMEQNVVPGRDSDQLSPTSEKSLVLSESSQSSYVSIENGTYLPS
jgi:hypothetical protein